MRNVNKIIIIGGGQAAIYAVSAIRKHNKEAAISIFNEEARLPYERPPLSKDFLMNKKKEDEFLFFSKDFFKEHNVKYINKKIIKVDLINKLVFVDHNNEFSYDKLLISTGSTNRLLKIDAEIDDKILYLRNIDDAKKIKHKILKADNITIIGGGFIGLEIASSLNQLNKEVSVIEISTQLMSRIIPTPIANLVKEEHLIRSQCDQSILSIIRKKWK